MAELESASCGLRVITQGEKVMSLGAAPGLPWVRDIEWKRKCLDTVTTRNLRCRDAGIFRFRCVALWVLCLIAISGRVATAATRPVRQQVDVLFLSSSDPDLPDIATLVEQTETRILNGSDKPVHFSFEYLQPSSSFADPSREKETVSYFLNKYNGQTFDLVIAINEETLTLAEHMKAKLFPDAPLLFFVSNPKDPSNWLTKKPGRTGVVREANYLPTLQLALRQNSGTSHVVVVSGSSDAEKVDVERATDQFRTYESNLEFQYLTNIQFSDLVSQLEHVPLDGIIVFLDFTRDSRGEQFIPARILPIVTKSANRPVYGTFSSFVGGGIVGGSVADLGQVGQVLGKDAVRLLRGEKAENIPVTDGDFQHYVMDWRELHRWGFSASQLPRESEVRFWEYSPWEMYRWRILGLSALLLIETLLIALLLHSISNLRRAQETLRRKDKDLAEAQRLARVGSWLWDATSETLTWSEELYRILGLDPKVPPLHYKDFAPLFPAESFERLRGAVESALRTGSVPDLDLEVARPDGTTRWVTVRGEALRDAAGGITQLRGTVQDITERKQAYETRFRLASIVESSSDAIISKNLDGIIMSWNRGAEHMFGFSAAETIGQPIKMIVPRRLDDEEEMILQKARLGEKLENYETVRLTKGANEIDISLTVSAVRDAGGRIVGASGIARDITDRKRAEQALVESERRFRVMANTAPVMIWTSGIDKLCDYFNQTWLDFTGRSLAMELGNGWAEGVHPDDLAACLETYSKKFDARQPFQMQYRLRRHDGQYRWLLDSAVPRFNGDGSFAGFIGSCIDITDRKLALEALTSVGRKLIDTQEEERRRIARELHDDINQRMALLSNGLLEFGHAPLPDGDPSQKEELQKLLQLTNEIATDIEQISHQLHPSKLHYLGLGAAIRDLCHECSRQYKIVINCVVRDLPEGLDESTSLSLFRTVQESLRNVGKHSDAHEVKVELTCRSGEIQLSISDDGVGFDVQDMENFNGLGLISMRERLRSVGGEFSISSKPSGGTQVEGRVPANLKLRREQETTTYSKN